jgi:hypothetical protein
MAFSPSENKRAGWPWRLAARAPTDPDVRALTHPVLQPTAWPPSWSPGLSERFLWTGCGASMCSTCFRRPGLSADASLPSPGSSRASSPASTVLSKRYDFLPPVPPHFVAFAWRYLSVHSFFSLPRRTSAPPRPGVGHPVAPARISAEEMTGSPKFLGNLDCPFAMFSRRRQDCGHQTSTLPQRGPWYVKSRGSHERSFDAQ